MTDLLFNGVLLSLIILFLSLAGTSIYNSKVNTEQLEFNRTLMLSSSDVKIQDVTEMFDMLISECFIEYFVYAPIDDGVYVNADKEKEIATEVSKIVLNRMTNEIIARLSKIYVINSVENISDIITKRVYIKVVDYVVDHNAPR